MMAKRAKYAATDANLDRYAVEPLMRWLIAVAIERTTIPYMDVRRRLEREKSFSNIFTTRIGHVAGKLMRRIQDVVPTAPLLNVLVVAQADGTPGDGAGGFMAERLGNRRLKEEDFKKHHPDRWRAAFDRLAEEVYEYGAENWKALYRRVFKRALTDKDVERERKKRQESDEEDGLRYGRRYGGVGGEGPFHKSLRLWVEANPHRINPAFRGAETDTEVDLDSGDRVDAVYYCADRTIVIEVKSRISNVFDLRRGVFQCIKYQAVKKAMHPRSNAPVEAYLVTEKKLPGEISGLLKRHRIRHYQAPQVRK